MKNFLFRLIAVLLGFSVAFGLAEIAVRVICPQEVGPPRFAFDPQLGEIPVPHQKARRIYPGVYDFTHTNNSLGFRGNREFGPKKRGGFRVLLLGDSFTYGLGVNDEQTFAYQLEHYLRQDNLPVEVINAGNPGHGTDYELKLFQTVGAGLRPDMTVLCFFHGDFERNARGEYYDIQPDGGLLAKPLDQARGRIKTFLFRFPGYNFLICWSQAANLVKQSVVNYIVKTSRDREGRVPAVSGLVISSSSDGSVLSTDTNRKPTEIYLNHLKEAVRQAGSGLVIFYIPVAREVDNYRKNQGLSPHEKAIKEMIETRGGTLHSLTPVLASNAEPIRELYYVEGHWTILSHLLAARYMEHFINSLLQERLQGHIIRRK